MIEHDCCLLSTCPAPQVCSPALRRRLERAMARSPSPSSEVSSENVAALNFFLEDLKRSLLESKKRIKPILSWEKGVRPPNFFLFFLLLDPNPWIEPHKRSCSNGPLALACSYQNRYRRHVCILEREDVLVCLHLNELHRHTQTNRGLFCSEQSCTWKMALWCAIDGLWFYSL